MKAFTLLELIVVLFIVVLLARITISGWHPLFARESAKRQMAMLQQAINYTRSLAIYRNKVARLLPLGQWQQGYEVCIAGHVIKQFHEPSHRGTIVWRNFPGYNYLAFTPEGFTANQNGTFSYIDLAGESVATLVVSQTGRVRIGGD